jgi:hypothetical protein
MRFLNGMDMDSDRKVTHLEVGAWFKRNSHIVCRPYRTQVRSKILAENTKNRADLSKYFLKDDNKNGKYEVQDALANFNSIDKDGNSAISKTELSNSTTFKAMK